LLVTKYHDCRSFGKIGLMAEDRAQPRHVETRSPSGARLNEDMQRNVDEIQQWLAEGDAIEIVPRDVSRPDPFGDGLVEKFRKQGLAVD
jgi:hypothetical protein